MVLTLFLFSFFPKLNPPHIFEEKISFPQQIHDTIDRGKQRQLGLLRHESPRLMASSPTPGTRSAFLNTATRCSGFKLFVQCVELSLLGEQCSLALKNY
ncbi:hypothetical protein ACJW31_09G155400 [Castanea mollissima]